jgi:F420-non-reducing hydrogenase iron-sulfur subunit
MCQRTRIFINEGSGKNAAIAYAAADLAGGLRIQYPPSVRIVKVPCSGRVEVTEILHAFERGVDGVMVAG